jgi:hypothetical protein
MVGSIISCITEKNREKLRGTSYEVRMITALVLKSKNLKCRNTIVD